MPIPQPNSGEQKDAYISRCVSFIADEDPDMPNDQRVAICNTQWSRSRETVTDNMHSSFKHFLRQFQALFKDGLKRFEDFVASYRLDVTRPYSDQVTRECMNGACEAFQWIKPFIQYLKEDETGKYYKVRVHRRS